MKLIFHSPFLLNDCFFHDGNPWWITVYLFQMFFIQPTLLPRRVHPNHSVNESQYDPASR